MKFHREFWMAVAYVIGFSVVTFGGGALWGRLMYRDWTCGMPGVHCVRVDRIRP